MLHRIVTRCRWGAIGAAPLFSVAACRENHDAENEARLYRTMLRNSLNTPQQVQATTEMQNYQFYRNSMPLNNDKTEPRCDELQRTWRGKNELLEQRHDFIQVLFPIRERGVNPRSAPLSEDEAQLIRNDAEARERVLVSYEIMLQFYGFELVDRNTGELRLSGNSKQRLHNLNTRQHNFLRITRILKSLGELGLEHLKANFVLGLFEQCANGTLDSALYALRHYWIPTLLDDELRESLLLKFQQTFCT
jgi:hypothetical protein